MKTLFSAAIAFFASLNASASILQCPNLTGTYFCKGVPGSHEDMIMKIRLEGRGTQMVYSYTYEQKGKDPFTLLFPASDQGVKHPTMDQIGRCWRGTFFNTKDGQLGEKTLLNLVNRNGDYDVVRYKDKSLFLRCPRQISR